MVRLREFGSRACEDKLLRMGSEAASDLLIVDKEDNDHAYQSLQRKVSGPIGLRSQG